jgi:uncharacterized protein (DUF2147 family)
MRLSASLAIAAVTLVGSTAVFAQSSPFGTWTRPSTGTQVNFYDCGGKLCAKITAVKDASRKGDVGKVIMSGAEKSGGNTWKGSLLNTEDGQTYNGVVTLEGPKALNLKGCVLGGIVCKGETWVRN